MQNCQNKSECSYKVIRLISVQFSEALREIFMTKLMWWSEKKPCMGREEWCMVMMKMQDDTSL